MKYPSAMLSSQKLRPKKNLGQYFLKHAGTPEMIVQKSGMTQDDTILEIGPGLGALTLPAARAAKQIFAVEKDPDMADILRSECANAGLSNVIILNQDILKTDIAEISRQNGGCRLIVIGNLPYNISSQVMVQLIKTRHAVNKAVLMFQKELSTRLMARPGTKDYGRITVMLRYCSTIRSLAHIPASQFFPKPKVDSEVIEICFQTTPLYTISDENFLFKVIKAAFGQRRKTLKNSLSGSEFNLNATIAESACNQAGIDGSRRAETLDVADFVKLSETLYSMTSA